MMAVNYNIQADVIDIHLDSPRDTDIFLVDTNVWFWTTYPNASMSGMPYQLSEYPNYINQALSAGSKINRSGLSMVELAHLIEKTERNIYERANGSIRPKEYRHNLPLEKSRVSAEVQAAWIQVKTLSLPLEFTIDDRNTDSALFRYQAHPLDGYDLFILETMSNHGIIRVISDDGDFATVPGIKVFTANQNVLNAARSQSRLIRR